MTMKQSLLILLVLSTLTAATAQPSSHGVIVEEVEKGWAAEKAGLEKGDVILSWSRAASDGLPPARGEIRSPFDLHRVNDEEGPYGSIAFQGRRGSQPMVWTLSRDYWHLTSRPDGDSSPRDRRLVRDQPKQHAVYQGRNPALREIP